MPVFGFKAKLNLPLCFGKQKAARAPGYTGVIVLRWGRDWHNSIEKTGL